MPHAGAVNVDPTTIAEALGNCVAGDEIVLSKGRYSPIHLGSEHSEISLVGRNGAVIYGGTPAIDPAARWPENGYTRIAGIADDTRLFLDDPVPEDWPDAASEVLVLLAWKGTRLPAHRGPDGEIVLAPQTRRPRYFRSEWDHINIIPGREAVFECLPPSVPRAAPLLFMRGCRNVHVSGITCENAWWTTPPEGAYMLDSVFLNDRPMPGDPDGIERSPRTPAGDIRWLPQAAVEIDGCVGCSVRNVSVTNVRGTGLAVLGGRDNTLGSLKISRTGCAGFVAAFGAASVTVDSLLIEDAGRTMPGCPGFAVVEAEVTGRRISVRRTPWSAFRLGAGPRPGRVQPTTVNIRDCDAEDCGLVMSDGAAYYMNGAFTNTTLEDCRAKRVRRGKRFANSGFFLDHVRGSPTFRRCRAEQIELGAAWRWYPASTVEPTGVFEECGDGEDHPRRGGRIRREDRIEQEGSAQRGQENRGD